GPRTAGGEPGAGMPGRRTGPAGRGRRRARRRRAGVSVPPDRSPGARAPSHPSLERPPLEAVEVSVDGLAVGLEPAALAVARPEPGEGLARRVGGGSTVQHQLRHPLADEERARDPPPRAARPAPRAPRRGGRPRAGNGGPG